MAELIVDDKGKTADLSFIRYANCWEDADVLLRGLTVSPGIRCLSVASAGDNTLSLLTQDPAEVVAFDLNPSQLACLSLKLAAFKRLDYEELLAFLGFKETHSRETLYQKVREELPQDTRQFWDSRLPTIRQGVIHAGKFERYFSIFRKYVLPLAVNEKCRSALLHQKSITEQRAFYREKWNNWRWRLIFRFFFSRMVMGRLGRDPSFFTYVDEPVAASILRRVEYALTEIPTHDNPYLRYIISGNFAEDALPHYIRREHYEKIKGNADRVTLVLGSECDITAEKGEALFEALNLSDIFEYMSPQRFSKSIEHIRKITAPGASIVFWNMLAPRVFPEDRDFHCDQALSKQLLNRDKAFFYQRLQVVRR